MSGNRQGARMHFGLPSLAEFATALVIVCVLGMGIGRRFLHARERARVSSVRAMLHETARAIESYHVDHLAYPAAGCAAGPSRRYESQQVWQAVQIASIPAGVKTINSFALGDSRDSRDSQDSGAARMVTFRIGGDSPESITQSPTSSSGLATLTTPIAYLRRFHADPFARTRGASFGYFSHGSGLGWIALSLGPDRDEAATGGPGDISPHVERLYDLNREFPYMWFAPPDLVDRTYDPSNGIFSDGDIYIRQGQ